MPLGKLLSAMTGGRHTQLDDGSWLPEAATHPPPEDAAPTYDLALQARLRRERDQAGEDASMLCLGSEPMGRAGRAFWSLLVAGIAGSLLTAAVWHLSGGVRLGWIIAGVIGLLALLIALHQLLASFNPTLSLRCRDAEFSPGRPATIHWRFSRPPRSAKKLVVRLACEERATYRQGTSDTTARETAFEEVRAEVDGGPMGPPTEGSFALDLPADAMHSFESDNNAVAWTLTAHAEIRFWPDVKREVPLRVWAGPEPTPAVEERP